MALALNRVYPDEDCPKTIDQAPHHNVPLSGICANTAIVSWLSFLGVIWWTSTGSSRRAGGESRVLAWAASLDALESWPPGGLQTRFVGLGEKLYGLCRCSALCMIMWLKCHQEIWWKLVPIRCSSHFLCNRYKILVISLNFLYACIVYRIDAFWLT